MNKKLETQSSTASSDAAMATRRSVTPSNIPVATKVVEPEIPWVDLRRFRQVMRAERQNVKGLNEPARSTPVYPFTTGIQVTNDGVGFGEEIIESRVSDGNEQRAKVTPEALRFRRTRSGKVPFKETKNTFFLLGLQGRDKK